MSSISFPGNVSFAGTVSSPLFVSNQQILAPVAAGTASTLTVGSFSGTFTNASQAYAATLTSVVASISTLSCGSINATFLSATTLSAGTYLGVVFNQQISSSGTTSSTVSGGTLTVGGSASFTGTITATGLGINNTSPAYALDVTGGGRFTQTVYANVGSDGAALLMDNSAKLTALNSSGVAENCLWPRWNDNVTYLNYGTGGLSIRNNSSSRAMFINNAGAIGINTTTPSYTLDIAGSARVTGSLVVPKQTPWTNVTFTSYSSYYGSGWEYPAYSIDALGIVRLRGMVNYTAINQALFTLPLSCTPASGLGSGYQMIFPCIANSAIADCRLNNTASGMAFFVNQANSSNTWVSLSGISYDLKANGS